jgi:hypothetical protein
MEPGSKNSITARNAASWKIKQRHGAENSGLASKSFVPEPHAPSWREKLVSRFRTAHQRPKRRPPGNLFRISARKTLAWHETTFAPGRYAASWRKKTDGPLPHDTSAIETAVT